MRLVNIDDEPFEAAPIAAAREQMTTACSMWASVEPRLVLQIKLTAWPALLAGSIRQLLQGVLTEGPNCSSLEHAFCRGFLLRRLRDRRSAKRAVPRASVIGLGSDLVLHMWTSDGGNPFRRTGS